MSWSLVFEETNGVAGDELRLEIQLTYLSQKHGGRTLKVTSNGHLKPYRSEKPQLSMIEDYTGHATAHAQCATGGSVGVDDAVSAGCGPRPHIGIMQITFLVMRLSKMGNEDRFSGVCSISALLFRGGVSAQRWDFWLRLEGECGTRGLRGRVLLLLLLMPPPPKTHSLPLTVYLFPPS